MKTFEYDFRYLQAGVKVLESYLLSKDTFWPVDIRPPAGEPDYPQLTLGGLLLSRARLSTYPKSATQIEQADQLNAAMDEIHSRWRVAWEKKAKHNFSIRLRMWSDFVEEYREDPLDNADRYAYEVRIRTILSLLKSEVFNPERVEIDLLGILDTYLKTVLVPDGFVWEPELQPGFPENIYWYLYGRLPSMPAKD